MTTLPVWQRWWVQSLIAVGISILIPIVTHALEWTRTVTEDITVGVGVWIVWMIFQIAYSLHSFHVERLEVAHVLEVIDNNDRLLLELQARFREIASRKLSGRPNHVFHDYCRRNLEHSLKVARSAAQHGELEVHDHHFDTVDTVLAAFDGCRDRTYRCVWLIERGEDLFDKYWRQYMKALVELRRGRRTGRRVRVRILFVADDETQLERASVKMVLGFVAAESGFEYRVISLDDYRTRLRDSGLERECIDFGIYGDHLLFRTTSYDPHVGVFSDREVVISAYRVVHDAAMNAVKMLSADGTLPANVSLEQFLNSDKVCASPARDRRDQ